MVRQLDQTEILLKGFDVLDAAYTVLDSSIPIEGNSCEGCCRWNTPISTLLEVKYLLSQNTFRSNELLDMCLGWLTEKHVGLNSYQRITGREYTPGEDEIIAQETEVVKRISCPFVRQDGACYFRRKAPLPCVANGRVRDDRIDRSFLLMRIYLKNVAPQFAMASFLPTLLAREINPKALKEFIAKGEIADAKIAIQKHLPSIYGDKEE